MPHLNYITKLSDFIIDEGLPPDVLPLIYVITGERFHEVQKPSQPYEFLGIHLMDTNEALRTPYLRYRRHNVIQKAYNRNLKPLKNHEKLHVSFISFEWWEFLQLLLEGNNQCVEILTNPRIHQDTLFSKLENFLDKSIEDGLPPNLNFIRQADDVVIHYRRTLV